MELPFDFKGFAFKLSFSILFFVIVLWFSLFLYGITYYLYIPAAAHVRPIHFQYPSCQRYGDKQVAGKIECPFPSANISLAQKGRYDMMSRGQAYTVEVTLEMPESTKNQNQGMFMIQMNMLSEEGKVTQSSSRPTLLHYKSSLFKTIYTLFFSPGLLAGTIEEKQVLVVPLFEEFEEDWYYPTHYVHVEIQARNIEVYSASLQIHAKFSGLRYCMYYWPLLSTITGVMGNFSFVSVMVFLTWLKFTMGNGNGSTNVRRISQPHIVPSQPATVSTVSSTAERTSIEAKDIPTEQVPQISSQSDVPMVDSSTPDFEDISQFPESTESEGELTAMIRRRQVRSS